MKSAALLVCTLLLLPQILTARLAGLRDVLRDRDSVYIRDIRSGLAWGQHERVQVPAASLIKLFVMVESFKAFKDGRLQRNKYYHLSHQDMVGGSGHLQYKGSERKLSWFELVRCMIQESDNTATNILIRKLGMAAINRTALQLGCHSTILARLMMDRAALRQGIDNLTSAVDVGRLLALLRQGSCVDKKSDRQMIQILEGQALPHKLGANLPPVARVAHKTGELALWGLKRVESDAGIIRGPGGEIIMVVISQGESANVERIRIMGKRAWDLFELGNSTAEDA